MTVYRLDRAPALAVAGGLVVTAALLGFVTVLMESSLLGVLTAVALLAAGWIVWRPPVVLRLDEQRLRTRRSETAWTDVEDVRHAEGQLMLTLEGDGAGTPQRAVRITLSTVGRRAPELVREIYDRLNAAYGYRRFDS